MGFLDSVAVPGATKTAAKPSGVGSFLNSVNIAPAKKQTDRAAQLETELAATQKEAEQANSISGLFKQTISNIWSSTKSYVVDSGKQAVDFEKNLILHPVKTLTKAYNDVPDHIAEAFKQNFNYGTDVVSGMMDDYQNGTGSTAGDVANLARLTSAVAGMLFSPVTGTLEAAQDFPVLKQAADVLNVPFSLSGLAGAYATGKVVDVLPISEDSKTVLKGPLEELGSLAAQAFVGGRVMAKVGDVVAAGREVTPAEANRIVSEVKRENPEVFGLPSAAITDTARMLPPGRGFLNDIRLPGQKAEGEAIRLGSEYDPYIPEKDLPVIEYGRKPKATEPVIQMESPSKRQPGDIPGMTYEPIPQKLAPLAEEARKYDTPKKFVDAVKEQQIEVPKEIYSTKPADANAPKQAAPTQEKALTDFYERANAPAAKVNVKDPLGEGEKRQSTLAAKVEANVIEKKLADSLGKLPEYRRVNLKDQAKSAADFLAKDPEAAMRVALGKEEAPSHLLPEVVFNAVEEMAMRKGDVEVLRQLASESNLSLQATAMGQRIRALGEREQDSPVRILQDIRDARTKAAEKRGKGNVNKVRKQIAEDIKKEIKKAVSKRPTWDEFIQEIQCKY